MEYTIFIDGKAYFIGSLLAKRLGRESYNLYRSLDILGIKTIAVPRRYHPEYFIGRGSMRSMTLVDKEDFLRKYKPGVKDKCDCYSLAIEYYADILSTMNPL